MINFSFENCSYRTDIQLRLQFPQEKHFRKGRKSTVMSVDRVYKGLTKGLVALIN